MMRKLRATFVPEKLSVGDYGTYLELAPESSLNAENKRNGGLKTGVPDEKGDATQIAGGFLCNFIEIRY